MSTSDESPKPGDGLSPEERDAFKKRAAELGERLSKVKAEARSKEPRQADGNDGSRGAAYGQAMKIAVELVVGIAVGGFIGRVLDTQFGTTPWMLIVFLIFGFAAGLLNVVRAAKRLQAEAEPLQRKAKPAPDDPEDDEQR